MNPHSENKKIYEELTRNTDEKVGDKKSGEQTASQYLVVSGYKAEELAILPIQAVVITPKNSILFLPANLSSPQSWRWYTPAQGPPAILLQRRQEVEFWLLRNEFFICLVLDISDLL